MALGAFITITDPEKRGDLYKECYQMASELFDVVTVIDGTDTWPKEFSWPVIGQHFQKGYEQTEADWVVHLDCDFIFHQRDFGRIKQAFRDYPNSPAISFYKWQFILPDRYNLKSRLVLAVNKGKFKDKIRFDSGGDLCQPSFNGDQLRVEDMPQAGVPFYNYEKILKTKEQVMDDQGRMERAYKRHFGHYQLAKDESNESAYQGWLRMQYGRLNKPHAFLPFLDHPKYMQDTIRNLRPDQFGYSAFNYEQNKYVDSFVEQPHA